MNINDITKCKMLASQEDDREHYDEQRRLAHSNGGDFKQIIDCGDMIVSENKTHYVINDCGVCSLYVKKEYENMWFQIVGRGNRTMYGGVTQIFPAIGGILEQPESAVAASTVDSNLVLEIDPSLPLSPITNFERIIKKHYWVAKTKWPMQTADGALIHLVRELRELKDAIANESKENQIIEACDVIFCVFSCLSKLGVSVDEIKKYMRIKADVNANREWVDNGDGSYSHV